RFIEEVHTNPSIRKGNSDYETWLEWAKEAVDQMDSVKLAEQGDSLPGQGEPDRKGFQIPYDWDEDYEDDEEYDDDNV
ncbi:MAG: hypothetical protein ACKVOY_07570, partial [Burkholderiaceae bacterium]